MNDWQGHHSREYQVLLDNIPGGVQQCLNDGFYTMMEVNQGFLDMFGYDREELSDIFHDHFVEMIHPDDREAALREADGQLKGDGRLTLSYRVLCKDGSYKWVMDNGQFFSTEDGEERIFCIMLDITESRAAREALRLSLERHRIIMNQTTDIIFEWNTLDDTMIFSGNWEKKFGYAPHYAGVKHPGRTFRNIHPDDIPAVEKLVENMDTSMPYTTIELRIQNSEGKYVWCRIRATDQYDRANRRIKTVGVITDIDKEKQMIDDLRKRAERDALTGLYNRAETERQIKKYLSDKPDGASALFMIDTDNFKQVNDGQGHLFGDAVLSELAAGMKQLTRRSDVVGRIGGDEFAIFLKDIPSKAVAVDRAAKLLEMFRHLFHEEKKMIQVTCSVGVAVYPEDGMDFQTLYHSADLALYQAKNQGKNRYVVFESGNTTPLDRSGYSSLGAAIDSDQRTSGLPGDLVNYVFQILYDTSDIGHAIQLILEIVGKRFDVSRAYIFENSDDGKYADNTFEWCNSGISPQKENLQHFPYEGLEGYEELFHQDSIFYCRDIHSLKPKQVALLEGQGICSTLQCAIWDNEEFRGFVGFDECTGMRMWTKEEIGVLSLVSQLLSTFLQKKRAAERDQQMAVRLNTILDVQDAYIYAISQENHELLYLNHKTRELDPEAEAGMTCYQAFFRRDTPCENCPLSGGDGEIYNPKYDVWTRVGVAPMKWGDRDAYLLSCFDITEYKRMQEMKHGDGR